MLGGAVGIGGSKIVPAGGAFNPADYVSNLFGYWNADNVVLSGSDVTSMTDLTAGGNDFAGGVSPAYNATGWGGTRPTVDFNGFLASAHLTANGVAANYVDTSAPPMAIVLALSISAGGNRLPLSISDQSITTQYAGFITGGLFGVYRNPNNEETSGVTYTANTEVIMSYQVTPDAVTPTLDVWQKDASTEQMHTGVTIDNAATAFDACTLGALVRTTIDNFAVCKIRALIMADAFTDRAGLVSALETNIAPL